MACAQTPAQQQRQIVLVFQVGGALGAYRVEVHEAKVEPDCIIGTSIGAINASLIAGNEPQNRLDQLEEFWRRTAGSLRRLPRSACSREFHRPNRARRRCARRGRPGDYLGGAQPS